MPSFKKIFMRYFTPNRVSTISNKAYATIMFADYQTRKAPLQFATDVVEKAKNCNSDDCTIVVNLDGTRGYSPSFVRSAILALKANKEFDRIKESIIFTSKEEPTLPFEIKRLISSTQSSQKLDRSLNL